MRRVLEINTFGVATRQASDSCIPRSGRSVLRSLSARVGSISDNRLGGWYSYRASRLLKYDDQNIVH